MTDTFQRLCAILVKDYKLVPEQLLHDTSLESLGIDSLGVADLLFNVEDEFHIKLPPEPVQLHSIGDVAAFIDQLVHATAPLASPAPSAALPAVPGDSAGIGPLSVASGVAPLQ